MSVIMINDGFPPSEQPFVVGDPHYRRIVFMVYWMDASPSAEVFYLRNHHVKLNPDGITALENEIVALMQTTDATMRVISATMVGYSSVEMSDDVAASMDWRVLSD